MICLEVIPREIIESDMDRKPSDELRYHAILDKIIGCRWVKNSLRFLLAMKFYVGAEAGAWLETRDQ